MPKQCVHKWKLIGWYEMGRHSIKFKITSLLTVIITSLVVLLLVFNNTLAEKFYFADKQKSMLSTYNQIDTILNKYDSGSVTQAQMSDSIEQLTTSNAISVIVVNSDWSTVYTNTKGENDMIDRLRMSIFNNDIFQNSGNLSPSDTSSSQAAADNKFSKNPPSKPSSSGSTDDSSQADSQNGQTGDNSSADGSTDSNAAGNTGSDGSTSSSDDSTSNSDGSTGSNVSGPAAGMFGNGTINMLGSGIGESREIIKQTENYTLQKIYDSRLGDDYYELWGTLSNGDSIMMRLAVQGIKDNVSISNTFISYVGIGILVIGIIAAYSISTYITRPIKQLSHLAERMTSLDFDAKYEGKDKSEIGVLGNSMNNMSMKLEENISQLKTANLELRRDIDRKIQIDEMRTDFLSNVSHELKTPIALIQGYAEGLKEGVTDDPESMDFYCDVIIDEANKMNNMVKKLLTLNQIEFGNEQPVMERFDLIDLITSIMNANELRASQKGIKMIFNQRNEHINAWSDEYKIEEVITNYITNAINHCDFDKIIEVKVTKMGDNVRVSVFNTGKNIPQEDIDNIWIKFYKVDKARTREYGGNGIGLSIVKAIMDSYGKECGVKNLPEGVEFWFDLDAKS
jgi:signal transduction histidine kinase